MTIFTTKQIPCQLGCTQSILYTKTTKDQQKSIGNQFQIELGIRILIFHPYLEEEHNERNKLKNPAVCKGKTQCWIFNKLAQDEAKVTVCKKKYHPIVKHLSN